MQKRKLYLGRGTVRPKRQNKKRSGSGKPSFTDDIGKIVQKKRGIFKIDDVAFFDYTVTSPISGMKNIGYVRDLPSVQLDFIGRSQKEVEKTRLLHKSMIEKLDGIVTMTVPLYEHIKELYDVSKPFRLFRNHPSWFETPKEKRDEFVYIGAIPVKFDNTLGFLSELTEMTGYPAHFIRRKDYKSNSQAQACMHLNDYDYGSAYGLLINENGFPQAEECLPRKLFRYLMCGIKPVFHESFVESIEYCREHRVWPLVYCDIQDLVDKLPEHDFGPGMDFENRRRFSMEENVGELIEKLDSLGNEIGS